MKLLLYWRDRLCIPLCLVVFLEVDFSRNENLVSKMQTKSVSPPFSTPSPPSHLGDAFISESSVTGSVSDHGLTLHCDFY